MASRKNLLMETLNIAEVDWGHSVLPSARRAYFISHVESVSNFNRRRTIGVG